MRAPANWSCSAARDSRVLSWTPHVVMDALDYGVSDLSVQPVVVVPLERAWGDGRRVADAQTALLLCLLLIVFLRERAEFCRVFLLYSAPVSVKLLDVVEPGDAAGDLQSHASVCEQTAKRHSSRTYMGSEEIADSIGTYPGVDRLEAILDDRSVHARWCRLNSAPSIQRQTAAQCRPPCLHV
jgi:hypothetical protein